MLLKYIIFYSYISIYIWFCRLGHELRAKLRKNWCSNEYLWNYSTYELNLEFIFLENEPRRCSIGNCRMNDWSGRGACDRATRREQRAFVLVDTVEFRTLPGVRPRCRDRAGMDVLTRLRAMPRRRIVYHVHPRWIVVIVVVVVIYIHRGTSPHMVRVPGRLHWPWTSSVFDHWTVMEYVKQSQDFFYETPPLACQISISHG